MIWFYCFAYFITGWACACLYWSPEFQGMNYLRIWLKFIKSRPLYQDLTKHELKKDGDQKPK